MRENVEFKSEDANLRGWLYIPYDSYPPPYPAIAMAHGFTGTRHMCVDRYAAKIADTGVCVLLLDHRNFGDSEGEPRQQINPWLQARGYRDALGFLQAMDDIDSNAIGVWGDSFSAGVVLVVASVDTRVSFLIAQVPAIGAEIPPHDFDGQRFERITETLLHADIQGLPSDVSDCIPVVSDDQVIQPSALTPLTAYRWFIEYGERPGSGWVNKVTRAQSKTGEPWAPALCASRVTCPALFLVSPEDEMRSAVPAVSRYAFDQLSGPKNWVDLEGGHFGLLYYPSPTFEKSIAAQIHFLRTEIKLKT